MDIESSRLILEPVTVEDGKMLIKNPMAYYFHHKIPYEIDWPDNALKALLPLYLERLEKNEDELGFGPWTILEKHKGFIVGEAGFKGQPDQDKTVEIGYQILKKYRNKGHATEAVGALCHWAFCRGVKVIQATCDKDNIASQKVLQNNGFRKVGQERGLIIYEVRKVLENKYQSTNT